MVGLSQRRRRRQYSPLTDGQRRQLQTAGSLRVTTDEQAFNTEITVPRDLGWLGQIKVIGHGNTPPAKSSDSSVSRGFLYVGLSPNQEDTAYHWATTHHIDPSYVMAPRIAPKVPLPAATLVATGLFTMMTVIMAGSWPETSAWRRGDSLRTCDASD